MFLAETAGENSGATGLFSPIFTCRAKKGEATCQGDRRYVMTCYKTMIVTWSILFLAPSSSWAQSIVAAVLPSSRSVQVGTVTFPPATPPPYMAFATIINAGQQLATDCGISRLSSIPAILYYSDLESFDYG